jgi:hypothetical protein
MSRLATPEGSVTEMRPGVYRLRVDAGVDPITGKRRQVSNVIHGGKTQANNELRRLIAEAESGVAAIAKQTVDELDGDW